MGRLGGGFGRLVMFMGGRRGCRRRRRFEGLVGMGGDCWGVLLACLFPLLYLPTTGRNEREIACNSQAKTCKIQKI